MSNGGSRGGNDKSEGVDDVGGLGGGDGRGDGGGEGVDDGGREVSSSGRGNCCCCNGSCR